MTDLSSPTTAGRRPSRRRAAKLLAPLLALSLLLPTAAAQTEAGAEAGWELRACADPNLLPFSGREAPGFENRVASLVAEAVGARLTYDWGTFTRDTIDLRFGEGECDVILGVPDGFEQGMTTIAYYQSPYVMVYRADAGIEVESLDDPALRELDLGVQGLGTPPHEALRQRQLLGQVKQVFGGEQGDDHLAVLVRAVADGQVDVGFGWGPAVGYHAARAGVPLVVKPVEPAFDFPNIVQSVPMVMAVRRDDVALRDLLNVGIARAWDDIQAVLAEYHVPVVPTPAPFLGERPADLVPTLQVGVVLPMPTGARTREAVAYTLVGDSARMGALLAEGAANAEASARGSDVRLLLANAPDAASAVRAAERLLTEQGAQALVGGVAAGQAEALARLAAEHGVPFVNVGDASQTLHGACHATTFHVQPSAAAYLSAMVASYRVAPGAPQRWFVVVEEGAEGEARLDAAAALVAAFGDELVGSAALTPARPVYFDVFDAATAAGADAVMVVLSPADQLAFMGQAEDAGLEALLAPFPDPRTQTRDFLSAVSRYGVGVEVPRLMLWEAGNAEGEAGALNERFAARWGQPFDAVGWATWRAVTLLADAFAAAGAGEALVAALAAPSGAGPIGPTSFGPDRALDQPLWLALPDPEVRWGITVSQRLATAQALGEAPAGPAVDVGCR